MALAYLACNRIVFTRAKFRQWVADAIITRRLIAYFSKRWMISPTRPRCTASGFSMMKLRSVLSAYATPAPSAAAPPTAPMAPARKKFRPAKVAARARKEEAAIVDLLSVHLIACSSTAVTRMRQCGDRGISNAVRWFLCCKLQSVN